MTQGKFAEILRDIHALSPEQMRQLRHELDRKLAVPETSQTGGIPDTLAPKPIWEVAAEIRQSIPKEEWAKFPTDGAAQHDHYLYGAPKRPAQ